MSRRCEVVYSVVTASRREGRRARAYELYRSSQPGALDDDRPARAASLRQVIQRHFPPDRRSKVIDLGCGSGTLIHFAREAGFHDTAGVDVSAEQIKAARSRGIEGIVQGEITPFLTDLPEASVDVIVAWDVVEHLDRDESLELADLAFRALRPGGRLVLHVPNAEALFGARIRYADWTHEQAFTRESVTQMLRVASFDSVQCFEDTPVVHGPVSLVRFGLWKFYRALLRLYVAVETGETGRAWIFTQNLLAVAKKAMAP